jgi:hypothetical protein
MAQSHSDIMVARSDSIPYFTPRDIRVDFRISPPELRFTTRNKPSQNNTA